MIKNGILAVAIIAVHLQVLSLIKIINCTQPPDLTLVVKNKDSNNVELICIAEGNVLNSAIGWIYPLVDSKDKLPEIYSSYVPDINNNYNCDFSKTKICNNHWQQMKDWHYSKYDAHNFKLTLDNRWEDFQTLVTSNATKEFNARIVIPTRFQIGFSVRTSNVAEIFLCEGWKPQLYPCYYINIGNGDNKQILLKKIKSIQDDFPANDTKFYKYKSETNLLSEDEWRNFVLSLDDNGTLILSEKHKDTVLVNFTDAKKPLNPTHFFVRSKNDTALWKIHQNQYIFTNKTGTTQLGPPFEIYGNELCISLHVSMCQFCKMTFSMLENGKMRTIKEVANEDEEKDLVWNEVRLFQKDIVNNKLKLFIKTKYVNNTLRNGFWAIDDVRMCAQNEIRVIRMQTRTNIGEIDKAHFSCQALDFPTWQPPQHFFTASTIDKEVKFVSSTSSSIRLSWKSPVDSADNYRGYYVINYEGQDLCEAENTWRNKLRIKSQGYILSKSNEVVINNLIPYTNYNITLWNIIEGNKMSQIMSTLPTDIPTKEELPKNLKIFSTDTTSKIQWTPLTCNESYGPVIYNINVRSKAGKDIKTFMDIKANYTVANLLPFTDYSVEVNTARNVQNLNNSNLFIKLIYYFTTLPGIAPSVENLELYAMDRKNAYFRFDLPKYRGGVPKEVQIRLCYELFIDGCSSTIQNLTRCKLWPEKYCASVGQLTANFNYKFRLSIKNDKTSAFGKEALTAGKAEERIPGTPENVSYKLTYCDKNQNYCNVNISWTHPYVQNATITAFDVVLNQTISTNTTDTVKSINEILKVENKSYQPMYSTNVTFISFNTPYMISVRAINNGYKGKFAKSIFMKINYDQTYINPTPEFIRSTNETIQFRLPPLDWRFNSSTLIIIVQDYDGAAKRFNEDIMSLIKLIGKNQLCNSYGYVWTAMAIKMSNNTSPIITVGDKTVSYLPLLNKSLINKPLNPNTEYCITFTFINQHEFSNDIVVYHEKNLLTAPTIRSSQQKEEQPAESTNAAAYLVPILFLILLIASGAWLTHRYLKKKRERSGDVDHIYESMPFEDYLPQAVSNQTYDRLLHD